ncbi:MAG: 30S ribosomal protein S17 [Planctomycetota bacterium]|jgi:small subunit ribosomal protein S17|nr:30S ribosomal protein S17 [Planctomycetota bacterium]
MSDTNNQRRARKTQVGKVTSDKRDKTITVEVERVVRHRMYDKFLRRRTKVHAHDENNEAGLGDVVELTAIRPLSKLKRWRLTRIVRKGEGVEA